MAIDPLSPTAPARVRAIVLPVGRIKRDPFKNFVDLLRSECIVRLGDVSPDSRPNRTMFSPLAFPNGRIIYDFSTSLSSSSHLALSPFEMFREALLVIGIADAREYAWARDDENSSTVTQGLSPEEDLQDGISSLHDGFPKALVHRLFLFNSLGASSTGHVSEDVIHVPPADSLKTTTLKTILCDLTALYLSEMTSLAISFQALPTINSPASSKAPTEDGKPWSSQTSLSRRNSQFSETSRSSSPTQKAVHNIHRMSMPAQLPSSEMVSTPETLSRTESPSTEGRNSPATTFDDIPGVAGNSLSRSNSSSSRPRSSTPVSGQEKLSMHGFGSGSVSERARNKGKCRIGIMMGSLYLSAGRWQDALRDLSENAASARTLSDHLWHAKALENIVVCMLLLSWAGLDYQIPQVCYPFMDKAANTKSPQHTPSNSVSDVSAMSIPDEAKTKERLHNLRTVLPDLIHTILNTYVRAANFPGESLPPIAYYECVIRLCKILAAIHSTGGVLTYKSLDNIVRGLPLASSDSSNDTTGLFTLIKSDISSLIQRALPSPQELSVMSISEGSGIFIGMASVLSTAGLHRKKALITKEFINFLIPALVHARKQGAAEMGIHPAAGLSLSNGATGSIGLLASNQGDSEAGLSEFLDSLGSIYGISQPVKLLSDSTASANTTDGPTSLSSQHAMQTFGNLHLKLDVLRMCINFCEALPDFVGIVRFTAALLRVAGPGTAPSPNSPEVFVSLAKEEQIRLMTTISRTVNTARKLGLHNIESEYWDDFLVRGLVVVPPPSQLTLTKHRKNVLDASQTNKNPFIHDPFLKRSTGSPQDLVLVVDDEYEFVVTLQNPYEFEVEILSLKLAVEGVDFEAVQQNLILGPYRTQRFTLIGIAREPGELKISGCLVKVKGCRERLFPVYADPWRPKPTEKVKAIGLSVPAQHSGSRPVSGISTSSDVQPFTMVADPIPTTLSLKVVASQPVVVLSAVSLPQSSLMMLEGEKSRFSITLRNVSTTTTTDFFHLSFQDSATSGIQNAMSNKDLPMSELHELEVQCANKPTFRYIQEENASGARILGPGELISFEIEVLGKAGLVDGVVQFDYGNTSQQKDENEFYSRQLVVPLSLTVNASIQLSRVDLLSFGENSTGALADSAGTISSGVEDSQSLQKHRQRLELTVSRASPEAFGSAFYVLLLDLRNAWPTPLNVSVQILDRSAGNGDEEKWENAVTIAESIQPGHVSRLVMALPKAYVPNPHAPIPSLNPANQRQFIVSTAKFSPEAERTNRECFWYREELLKRLRGTWKVEGSDRTGELDLRGIRLSPRMVEAMKLDDIVINMSVVKSGSDELGLPRQLGLSKFEVEVNCPSTVRTVIQNRSSKPICSVLRLQPSLAHVPHNAALDLNKKLAWSGLLQRPISWLAPGASTQVDLVVYALCSGIFEISVTVEELISSEEMATTNGSASDKTRLGHILDHLQGDISKKVWHAKEPCTIVSRENGQS